MSDSSHDNPIESELEKLKIGTEPKSLEFSDLNDDAIGLIIDELELKERLILRKVSSGFRELVDRKKSILKTLKVTCETDHIIVGYNNSGVVYAQSECDSNQIMNQLGYHGKKLMKAEDYSKMVLDDLQSVFEDPTVQLDELKVDYYPPLFLHLISNYIEIRKFFGELEKILKSLDHKVSVRKIEIDAHSSYDTFPILPYLKPGTLEVIDLRGIFCKESEVNRIVNLQQWKQAKELRLKNYWSLPLEKHLMHFKRFLVYERSITLESILKWRNFFSKSPNFEFAEIYINCGFWPRDIQNHLGDVICPKVEYGKLMYIIHHPKATNSNYILEIKLEPFTHNIFFTKIARPL